MKIQSLQSWLPREVVEEVRDDEIIAGMAILKKGRKYILNKDYFLEASLDGKSGWTIPAGSIVEPLGPRKGWFGSCWKISSTDPITAKAPIVIDGR